MSIVLSASIVAFTACGNQGDSFIPTEHFEGTCISKGYTRYYLSNGAYIDRPDETFGDHEYVKETISTQSCTVDGVERFTCKHCQDTYDEVKPKFNHDFKVTAHKDADCSEEGYTSYKCEICGDTRTDTEEKAEHVYEIIDSKNPTENENGFIEYKCKLCGNTYTETVYASAHVYKETVLEEPTCTKEGTKLFHCDHCNDEYTESIPALPHTPDTEVFRNKDGHWHLCKVCKAICGSEEHDYNKTEYVQATCIAKAYTRHICDVCEYSYNVTDDNSTLASHVYEAYTCKVCQRDELLQYVDKFNSKGNTQRNPIEIRSENEFVLFFDYLILNEITEYKYIKPTYITLTESNIKDVLYNISRSITNTNWELNFGYYQNSFREITSVYAKVADNEDFNLSQAATVTPDQYDSKTYTQFKSFQFSDSNGLRPNDFDDFAYKKRLNSLSVKTSDNLFYAFEHGYAPQPENGSAAQKMLDKAKAVARRIMNDDMTDIQKIKAIYTYLVEEVEYDHGVILLTGRGEPFTKYTSYYLEGVFDHGVAVCDGIAKAFCVLAGLENIKCVRVTSTNHAWNKFYIDINGDGQKEWYCSDATWGNQGIEFNREQGEYLTVDDFLFTDLQKSLSDQTALNYRDAAADDVENPFEHFYFGETESEANDFVIISDDELANMIRNIKNAFYSYQRGDVVTVQLFITSDYCNRYEIEDTVHSVITAVWLLGSAYSISISSDQRTYGSTVGYTVTLLFPKVSG